MPEQTVDVNVESCACFIDWQKEFERVNGVKLMQILKETGFDLHVVKLISRLYIDQNVRMGLDQWETRCVNIGKELDKGGVCHRFCPTYAARTLPRELLRGLETSE